MKGYRDVSLINQRLMMNIWPYTDGRPVYWFLADRGLIVGLYAKSGWKPMASEAKNRDDPYLPWVGR